MINVGDFDLLPYAATRQSLLIFSIRNIRNWLAGKILVLCSWNPKKYLGVENLFIKSSINMSLTKISLL